MEFSLSFEGSIKIDLSCGFVGMCEMAMPNNRLATHG